MQGYRTVHPSQSLLSEKLTGHLLNMHNVTSQGPSWDKAGVAARARYRNLRLKAMSPIKKVVLALTDRLSVPPREKEGGLRCAQTTVLSWVLLIAEHGMALASTLAALHEVSEGQNVWRTASGVPLSRLNEPRPATIVHPARQCAPQALPLVREGLRCPGVLPLEK
jgi:hypothetical protein